MSTTPITDAREFEILSDLQSGSRKVVDAEVCRKLERDNNRLRELLDNAASTIKWAAETLKP